MRYICSKCNLKDEIEDTRFKLNDLIEKEKHDLSHENILKLSQKLDELIVCCTICKKKRGQAYKSNAENIANFYSNYMCPLKELNYNTKNNFKFNDKLCMNKDFKRKILV